MLFHTVSEPPERRARPSSRGRAAVLTWQPASSKAFGCSATSSHSSGAVSGEGASSAPQCLQTPLPGGTMLAFCFVACATDCHVAHPNSLEPAALHSNMFKCIQHPLLCTDLTESPLLEIHTLEEREKSISLCLQTGLIVFPQGRTNKTLFQGLNFNPSSITLHHHYGHCNSQ